MGGYLLSTYLHSRLALGRAAKRPVLDINADKTDPVYSDHLAQSIAWAAARDPTVRPGGWDLVQGLVERRDCWAADPGCQAQVEVAGVLPAWAAEHRVV